MAEDRRCAAKPELIAACQADNGELAGYAKQLWDRLQVRRNVQVRLQQPS